MSGISQRLNDELRGEKSWTDVAGGLGNVLIGYAIFTIGYLAAGGFFFAGLAPALANKAVRIEHVWYFYIGSAILGVTGLLAWGTIIAGQFRCLMSCSERNGAKWVIFFCLTCVVMGPVLNVLAWYAGLAVPVRWTGGPQAFLGFRPRFNQTGLYLMCSSLISGGLYILTFWYFLQTVTTCLEATKARVFVWGFFLYVATMVGVTYYVAFGGGLHPNKVQDLMPWVAAGWFGMWLYWVVMIVVVKVTIEQTMALVFNPMVADAPRAQLQLAGS